MKNLKQEIDDLIHKKVIAAYFDNSDGFFSLFPLAFRKFP